MMRKHLDHYASKLSASILAADTTCTPNTPPAAPPAGFYRPMQLQDHPAEPTFIETVFVTAVSGSTVTITREAEHAATNPARDWTVDASNDVWLVSIGNATSLDEVNGALLVQYREKTGTALSSGITMANGPEQDFTMHDNTVFSFPDMQDGQNLTLHVFGGESGWVPTFPPSKTNFDTFPDLSSVTEAVFLIWKKGNQLYISYQGAFS